MDPVRVAFIGAGSLANAMHYPSVSEADTAELVAICYLDGKAAVLERGQHSMAMAEFHKDMLRTGPYWDMSILRTDIIHVVDALRDMGGDVVEVAAHVDHHYVTEGWENSFNLFNALLR